jgi:4-amino-4-deoxy-L-arabinose transferase-like glycosyltransferase
MTKTLKIGLICIFLLQLVVAAGFELAHDEAYYWLFSNNLDWGYFDHPPVVGLVIRLFSFLPHSELSVRIGFILMQFGSLFLIFKLIPQKFWSTATLLFFAFPLASFTGLLALPDMPLLFMTAVYCVTFKRYLEKDDALSVLLLGLSIPILLYAKFTL